MPLPVNTLKKFGIWEIGFFFEEKDKRRRKKSKAKHDEMIDKIILGIEKPPEPKLK